MPITDPIPDEDIREGYNILRHHHEQEAIVTEQGHGEAPSSSRNPPPPPPRHIVNEEVNPQNVHHHHTKKEHEGALAESQSASPFPDIDIFLFNETQQPAPNSGVIITPVPLQSQGSNNIVDILNPGQVTSKLSSDEGSGGGKPHIHSHSHTHSLPRNTNQSLFDHTETVNKKQKTDTAKNINIASGDIQERVLIAQWPPRDQIDHHHHHQPCLDELTCEPINNNDGNINGVGGEREWMGPDGPVPRRKGRKPWLSPSMWLERRSYKVSTNLMADWKTQASFFTKVILTKVVQLLVINLWILLVGLNSQLREFIVLYHNWMYLPLGVLLVTLIFIRIIAKSKSGWFPPVVLILLIVLTLSIAYCLAAVTFTYEAYCIPMVTSTLLLTCLTLPFVPYMTRTSVIKPTVVRIGAVLILIYAVLLLVVVAYTKYFLDMTQFATLAWFPGLLMAEIVFWVTIYEIQRILKGFSFNVTERRWHFAALYV